MLACTSSYTSIFSIRIQKKLLNLLCDALVRYIFICT